LITPLLFSIFLIAPATARKQQKDMKGNYVGAVEAKLLLTNSINVDEGILIYKCDSRYKSIRLTRYYINIQTIILTNEQTKLKVFTKPESCTKFSNTSGCIYLLSNFNTQQQTNKI
jgi:hypothetical protein